MNFGPLTNPTERNEFLMNYLKMNGLFETFRYIAANYPEMTNDIRRFMLNRIKEHTSHLYVDQNNKDGIAMIEAHLDGKMPPSHYNSFRLDFDRRYLQKIEFCSEKTTSLFLAISHLLSAQTKITRMDCERWEPDSSIEKALVYTLESLADPSTPNFSAVFAIMKEWFTESFITNVLENH